MLNFPNLKDRKVSPKTVGIVFLVFCLLSSLNIIIYNEETLVALSFVLFVFFVFHYFGNTLKGSLDERSEGIKAECQNFLHYKQQSLQQLCAEHEKIAQMQDKLTQLRVFVKEKNAELTKTGKHSLQSTLGQQLIQKCNELQSSQLSQQVQALMAKNQQQLVLARCAKEQKSNLSDVALKRAITLLISTVSKGKKQRKKKKN